MKPPFERWCCIGWVCYQEMVLPELLVPLCRHAFQTEVGETLLDCNFPQSHVCPLAGEQVILEPIQGPLSLSFIRGIAHLEFGVHALAVCDAMI